MGFGQPARLARRLARLAAHRRRAVPLVAQVARVRAEQLPAVQTLASSSLGHRLGSSSRRMRTSTPDRDVARRRAEEDEEVFTGSFSKKTPPKKTAVSRRWNHYTFTSVLAAAPSIAIHRGVVAAIHRLRRAREVGFVRREKGSMHLLSRANVPAAPNGGHDRPSLSSERAPQAPNGYCRSVPPHVRGRAQRLTSIRFRYAYGKIQASIVNFIEQIVSMH